MFERSKADGAGTDTWGLSVAIILADGTELKGRLAVPQGRSIADALNGPAPFIEFEAYEGPRSFIAKHTIGNVRLIGPPRGQSLGRMRDTEGFDPYSVLGLPTGAPFEDVRAAYLTKAKTYHPDRYANAELPDEVRRYLEDTTRRINAAFSALEVAPRQQSRPGATQRIAPIYSSPTR